jgi:hypothetical protein
MEELKQEEPKIEIYKPVRITIELSGYAMNKNNQFVIRWFDNTEKVTEVRKLQYYEYDFNLALQQVATLYQLNSDKILTIKLSTI